MSEVEKDETVAIHKTAAVNSDERQFDLELTKGSVLILRQMLQAKGWTKKVKTARKACKLVKRLPKLKPNKDMDADAFDLWSEEQLLITIGESDRDLTKVCIRYFIEEGFIDNTESTLVLIDEFGVTEE